MSQATPAAGSPPSAESVGAASHEAHQGSAGPRRLTARRIVRVLLLVVALDLVLGLAGLAVGGYEALAVQRQIKGGGSASIAAGAPAIRDRLRVAGAAFGLARVCSWPWRPLAYMAALAGGPARAAGTVGPLLDLAADGSAAGAHALDGALPLLSTTRSGHRTAGDTGARLLTGLQQGRPALHAALDDANRAAADWASLNLAALPASWQARLSPVARYLSDAHDVLSAALAAPDLLGATRPRDYLLVPQNPWDLRATGGFASTAVLLDARHGHLTLARSLPSDAVDNNGNRPPYIQPPLPLTLYAHRANWYYRDANWSPDFPTTAAVLRYFYHLGQKVWPDGVIAFDSSLLGPLLQITGPVSVQLPGTTTAITLTAQNGVQTLDRFVNFVGVAGKQGVVNKSLTTEAYRAIFQRLRSLHLSDMLHAARVLGTALQQRHLLVWLPDPTVEPILARRGWDGAIDPTRADYLYVVDTNMQANKINQRIQEGITYHAVVEADRSLRSTMTITYTNGATLSNIPRPQNNTLYEDYVRVYVPLGSRLVGASGFTQRWPTTRAYNKEVFAGYLRLPSLQHATVTLTYVVPPNALLDAPTYSLTIQKQPGTDAVPLSVEVRAGAPGMRVGGVPLWSWRGERRTDVTLTASLVGGHARPIPLVYDANPVPLIGPGAQIEPGLTLPATPRSH